MGEKENMSNNRNAENYISSIRNPAEYQIRRLATIKILNFKIDSMSKW